MFHNFALIPSMVWTNLVYNKTYYLIFFYIIKKIQSWTFYNWLIVNIINLSYVKLLIITFSVSISNNMTYYINMETKVYLINFLFAFLFGQML